MAKLYLGFSGKQYESKHTGENPESLELFIEGHASRRRMIWFLPDSNPTPPSRQQVVSLSQFSCVCRRSNLQAGEEGKGPNHTTVKKPWSSVNHSLLCFCHITDILCMRVFRDGIVGHQFDKRLESFAPFYSQSLPLADFTENHTLLWIRETRKLSLFMDSICRTKNEARNQTKTQIREDNSLCPETSTKNALQEFHLWLI